MNNGFIQNEDLLEEKSQVNDMLDSGLFCQKFISKLDSIIGTAVISLVGPFGSGKSTMLYQIMNSNTAAQWVEFDAWKYPDRKDLWEGFVIDLISSICPQKLATVKGKIKGTQNDDKKALIKVLSKIPGFAAIEGFNHFLETSPATRVNEIQNILREHLEGIEKDLFIVIEDIDRSGDAGIFFLETLKQFLRTSCFTKKIVVIVPIANENYEKNIDSYLKCIDYFEFFEHGEMKLAQFVDEIFDKNLFTEDLKIEGTSRVIWSGANRRSQTISFLEGLFEQMPKMSLRLLKLIIRKANLTFKTQSLDDHDPDYRITICFEASKYFKKDEASTYYDDFKKNNTVPRGNIFSSFLFSILINGDSIYELRRSLTGKDKVLVAPTRDFKLFGRANNNKASYPSYPWEYNDHWDKDKSGYALANFYIKY